MPPEMDHFVKVEPSADLANSPIQVSTLVKSEVNCPVCESSSKTVLYRPTVEVTDPKKLYGAASGIRGTQTLVTCNDCAMIFESPRYPEAVILAGYQSSDEHGHDSQYPMRVESFYRSLKSLGSRIPKPGSKVLDIGTAGGAFLDAAQKFGYQTTGLEPSQFLVQRGQARGLNLHLGTIRENNLPAASFDMICLWDVIEHLVDPKEDLKMIRRLLKPNGILLINFPDIGTTQAKLAGEKFWWILSVHLHHFSRKTIELITAKTGFKTVYFQRYWQTLSLGYLFQVAIHLKVPTAGVFYKILPKFLRELPIPYYASQTTALAVLSEGAQ